MSYSRTRRGKLKEWKNNRKNNMRTGDWTRRIIWYEQESSVNIRLKLEDMHDRILNVYPKTKDQADRIWEAFKAGASVVDASKII